MGERYEIDIARNSGKREVLCMSGADVLRWCEEQEGMPVLGRDGRMYRATLAGEPYILRRVGK
jgi:hypothetical protein